MCDVFFQFLWKSLLSVFPSFRGRLPGAKKTLDICGGLQILPAGCNLAEPVFIPLRAHMDSQAQTHKQQLKSPVGLTKHLSGLGHLSNLSLQTPPQTLLLGLGENVGAPRGSWAWVEKDSFCCSNCCSVTGIGSPSVLNSDYLWWMIVTSLAFCSLRERKGIRSEEGRYCRKGRRQFHQLIARWSRATVSSFLHPSLVMEELRDPCLSGPCPSPFRIFSRLPLSLSMPAIRHQERQQWVGHSRVISSPPSRPSSRPFPSQLRKPPPYLEGVSGTPPHDLITGSWRAGMASSYVAPECALGKGAAKKSAVWHDVTAAEPSEDFPSRVPTEAGGLSGSQTGQAPPLGPSEAPMRKKTKGN